MIEGRLSANTAAEYHVASQLARLGWKVRITRPHGPSGTKTARMDLVAERRGRSIRVDARGLKNMTNWPMPTSLKRSPERFLALVCYKKRFKDLLVEPEVFVIPSRNVKKLLGRWSGRPKQRGISYRTVAGTAYRDAWHLLSRTR